MWTVYVVECADKSLYTGIAVDVKKRLATHGQGKGSKILRGKLPIKLVYEKTCRTKSVALKREARLKSLPREKKLALINGLISWPNL